MATSKNEATRRIRELEAQIEELKQRLHEERTRLVEADKKVLLGELAAGIAHEINTPLGALKSNTDLLLRTLERIREILSTEEIPESVREHPQLTKLLHSLEHLNRVNANAIDRIVEIVNSIRAYARPESTEPISVDLREVLDGALSLAHHQLKNRITVHREYQTAARIMAHPSHLNQVFLNLLVNACQAIEGKGDIYIRIFEQESNAVVEIQDTGKGIPPEQLSRIFEPGFTTKPNGMGMGLVIVSQIIEAHGGKIEVESEVGKGTLFRIILPPSGNKVQ